VDAPVPSKFKENYYPGRGERNRASSLPGTAVAQGTLGAPPSRSAIQQRSKCFRGIRPIRAQRRGGLGSKKSEDQSFAHFEINMN
jgi:hypothetical protein